MVQLTPGKYTSDQKYFLSISPKQWVQGCIINSTQDMIKRFRASMLLAAVGDAMGYKRGQWEFNKNGPQIHADMMNFTKNAGIKGLNINTHNFPFSDDTVMHIATAQALIQTSSKEYQVENICRNIAKKYKECMKDMNGRAPGMTCIRSANKLSKSGENWKDIVYEKNAGGCGAAMRAACIGLYYCQEKDLDRLIAISIESGRITHHNPIGYLGSFVAALFTSYAVRDIPPKDWLYLMLHTAVPKALEYVRNNRQGEENINGGDWNRFWYRWQLYAKNRNMKMDSPSQPRFPQVYGVKEREKAYHDLALNNWPGALGVDSVIIAYDALLSTLQQCSQKQTLGVKLNKWEQLCLRGVLHGGDNDSTGTIAGAWYGALYGFDDVFPINYEKCERKDHLEQLGSAIYERAYQQKKEIM